MDRVAAVYHADAKKAGKDAKPPVATPPCADPGPFVSRRAERAPLEAAGAHRRRHAAAPPSTPPPAEHGAAPKKSR